MKSVWLRCLSAVVVLGSWLAVPWAAQAAPRNIVLIVADDLGLQLGCYGDPYVKTLPSDSVGVLAGVRNCWFKGPVLPDTDVSFHIHCRQMAPVLVQVNARIEVADVEVAKLDVVIAYAPREQLFAVPA